MQKNLPEDFNNYKCQPDEVKLCVPLYNVETGEFKGLRGWLAYIMVRGDENEILTHQIWKRGQLQKKLLLTFSKMQRRYQTRTLYEMPIHY